jgi:hypothetical protein
VKKEEKEEEEKEEKQIHNNQLIYVQTVEIECKLVITSFLAFSTSVISSSFFKTSLGVFVASVYFWKKKQKCVRKKRENKENTLTITIISISINTLLYLTTHHICGKRNVGELIP